MSRTPALDGLKEMRRVVASVPSPEAEHERRERIVTRLAALQGELSRQRQGQARLRRGLLAAALVAALAAVSVFISKALVFPPGTSPAAVSGGLAGELTARIVAGHLLLKEGGETRAWDAPTLDLAAAPLVQAPAGEGVDLELPSAAAVEVAASSELAFQRHKQLGGWRERVDLHSGRVRLRVPKLGAGASLAVQTPDALVEVRGTRFSVAVVRGESAAASTRVEVEEGRVAVTSARGQEFIGPGEVWVSGAAPKPAAPAAEPGSSALAPEAAARRPTPRAARRAAPPAAAEPSAAVPTPEQQASALAEQNRLFQGAALAKKRGLPNLALARLETLMQSHPDSELAHNARVEHFRLLRELGSSERARASARQYLERYPAGFARREAEELERGGKQPK